MAENNRYWPDVITKFPGWITSFIALVIAVVGFIKLWQGDTGLVTIVLLAVGIGGGWLSCLYLAFKRTPPRGWRAAAREFAGTPARALGPWLAWS